jgi:hypothetical protein
MHNLLEDDADGVLGGDAPNQIEISSESGWDQLGIREAPRKHLPKRDDASRGGDSNSHILIQRSAEFGVRGLLSKIPRNSRS